MAQLVHQSTTVPAVGTKPKRIEEFVGRVNTGHTGISLAKMSSPEGWQEPGQRPKFEEFTLVLSGLLRVETKNGRVDVRAGQAVITSPGEWVRYSTPDAGGADYIAVCQPAFSPETVNRDT